MAAEKLRMVIFSQMLFPRCWRCSNHCLRAHTWKTPTTKENPDNGPRLLSLKLELSLQPTWIKIPGSAPLPPCAPPYHPSILNDYLVIIIIITIITITSPMAFQLILLPTCSVAQYVFSIFLLQFEEKHEVALNWKFEWLFSPKCCFRDVGDAATTVWGFTRVSNCHFLSCPPPPPSHSRKYKILPLHFAQR